MQTRPLNSMSSVVLSLQPAHIENGQVGERVSISSPVGTPLPSDLGSTERETEAGSQREGPFAGSKRPFQTHQEGAPSPAPRPGPGPPSRADPGGKCSWGSYVWACSPASRGAPQVSGCPLPPLGAPSASSSTPHLVRPSPPDGTLPCSPVLPPTPASRCAPRLQVRLRAPRCGAQRRVLLPNVGGRACLPAAPAIQAAFSGPPANFSEL